MLAQNTNTLNEVKSEKNINQLLAVSVFFLTTLPLVSLVIWGGLIVYTVFHLRLSVFSRSVLSYRFFVLMISLYIIYLLGMLWTEHLDKGWEDLGVKVPLVLFPFLFLSIPISRSSYGMIRKALIFGTVLSVLICSVRSIYQYYTTLNIQSFYYTSYSFFLHPTYYTMYLNLSILFLIQMLFDTSMDKRKERVLYQFLLLLCVSAVVLVNSRLGMLTVVATVLLFTLVESLQRKVFLKNLLKYIITIVMSAILFQILVQGYNRFDQIKEVIEKKEYQTSTIDTLSDNSYNSTTTRIVLLENGLRMFKDHWFVGVGTGDVMPMTTEYLQKSGYTYIAHKYAVPHNQYLQTAVTLGIWGLAIFTLMLLVPLGEFWQKKEYLFFAFMLIVIANAMGDTVLRASSLYFFSFFGCYFYKLFKTEQQ